jgi:hypothetical protein
LAKAGYRNSGDYFKQKRLTEANGSREQVALGERDEKSELSQERKRGTRIQLREKQIVGKKEGRNGQVKEKERNKALILRTDASAPSIPVYSQA